jgi:hypothetical protein
MVGQSWVSWVFTCQGELGGPNFMVEWSWMSWIFTFLKELGELDVMVLGELGFHQAG